MMYPLLPIGSRSRVAPRLGSFILLLLLLSACGNSPSASPGNITREDDSSQAAEPVIAGAQATLTGTDLAPEISGEISLEQTSAGLKMQGTIENVPAGMHGFHIHEGSSCDDNAEAAGGHFNPRKVAHGHLPSTGFDKAHAGDLGNLQAPEQGPAQWSLAVPGLTLTPGELSVANRAIVLHAKADDLGQPSGNAGDRIACGVIQPVAQAQ